MQPTIQVRIQQVSYDSYFNHYTQKVKDLLNKVLFQVYVILWNMKLFPLMRIRTQNLLHKHSIPVSILKRKRLAEWSLKLVFEEEQNTTQQIHCYRYKNLNDSNPVQQKNITIQTQHNTNSFLLIFFRLFLYILLGFLYSFLNWKTLVIE